jgi:DNA-directed RNA polymerase subunit alpha
MISNINMELFLLPKNVNVVEESENKATIVVEPCYFGYGTTLGNALRRVLLSSLPGAAVTAVKIKGVDQEFQAIPKVKEDALNIILNLKNLRVKVYGDEPVKLLLKAKGDKKVTAKDIEKNSQVEIVNPELYLATLTDKKADLEMEITVQSGRGYLPVEERDKEELEIGSIMVDAIFSPVKTVGYKVENTRVGDITDYDKLTMEIETDGSIAPLEALSKAATILISHFEILVGKTEAADEQKSMESTKEETTEVVEAEPEKVKVKKSAKSKK